MERAPVSDAAKNQATPCGYCNINALEVKKRQAVAMTGFTAAFLAVILSKLYHQYSWLGLLPSIPFFVAYLGLLQARARTCVLFAFKELDLSGSAPKPIADRETGWQLKMRSIKIIIKAGSLAILSTAICWKL